MESSNEPLVFGGEFSNLMNAEKKVLELPAPPGCASSRWRRGRNISSAAGCTRASTWEGAENLKWLKGQRNSTTKKKIKTGDVSIIRCKK